MTEKRLNPPAKKAALVTGAAKRLGQAIALSLADAGFSIIVHYHTSKKAALDLCKKLSKKNVSAWAVQADLANQRALNSLIDRSLDLCGELSVLVNNASIFPATTLFDMTDDDFDRCMRVNAWAPLCLSRAFAARIKHGAIVNILDARTTAHDRTHVAYSLSKSALASATTLCALEFAPGIRVNAVAPGLILPPPGKGTSYLEKMKNRVPLRAYGSAQDIADAVVYLVKSNYITGEILHVDGGRRHAGYCFEKEL